jgi:hypothetical protein
MIVWAFCFTQPYGVPYTQMQLISELVGNRRLQPAIRYDHNYVIGSSLLYGLYYLAHKAPGGI